MDNPYAIEYHLLCQTTPLLPLRQCCHSNVVHHSLRNGRHSNALYAMSQSHEHQNSCLLQTIQVALSQPGHWLCLQAFELDWASRVVVSHTTLLLVVKLEHVVLELLVVVEVL